VASSKAILEAFEGFWAAYPSRPDNPKAPARLVFERRVREGADADFIVRAAGRYAAFCASAKKDPEFLPHARTWLSQRRYEDYPDAPDSPPEAETPEHPLAWLKAAIGEASWKSWIAPLDVLHAAHPVLIIAQTQFALDHVKREWGYLIRAQMGADVGWAVKQKD
jgi:hypothetical protein